MNDQAQGHQESECGPGPNKRAKYEQARTSNTGRGLDEAVELFEADWNEDDWRAARNAAKKARKLKEKSTNRQGKSAKAREARHEVKMQQQILSSTKSDVPTSAAPLPWRPASGISQLCPEQTALVNLPIRAPNISSRVAGERQELPHLTLKTARRRTKKNEKRRARLEAGNSNRPTVIHSPQIPVKTLKVDVAQKSCLSNSRRLSADAIVTPDLGLTRDREGLRQAELLSLAGAQRHCKTQRIFQNALDKERNSRVLLEEGSLFFSDVTGDTSNFHTVLGPLQSPARYIIGNPYWSKDAPHRFSSTSDSDLYSPPPLQISTSTSDCEAEFQASSPELPKCLDLLPQFEFCDEQKDLVSLVLAGHNVFFLAQLGLVWGYGDKYHTISTKP